MKTPRKDILIPLLLLAVITLILILSGVCGWNQYFPMANLSTQSPSPIEIYHFHGTHQCYTCTVLGKLAEETVNTSFAAERDDGRLIFDHINIDLPENANLVSRFGANTSSLMIGYTNETGFHAENQIQLWHKIGDKIAFGEDLTRVIKDKLNTHS